MIYAITGATGQTGHALITNLIGTGQRVRAIVRDAAKAEPLRALGAEIAVAELSSVEQLTRALAGAEAVYAMAPPANQSADPIGDVERLAATFATAIAAISPRRLVVLSSIGAQRARGLIRGLAAMEEALRDAAPSVTLLRAAWFYENWRGVIDAARGGVLPSFLAPIDRAAPQVAVADIAQVAAECLASAPVGSHVLELVGPRDLSPNDVALALGHVLQREVLAQAIPDEAMIGILESFGFSTAAAGEFRAMVAGFNDGTMTVEDAGAIRTGTRTIETALAEYVPVSAPS